MVFFLSIDILNPHLKNGIINLDKPDYLTCNQIIKLVKQIFKIV
jgi:tRNA U55 pseudouridine synthase TruB